MNRTMSRQPLMPHSARSRSDPIIAYSTSSGLYIYQMAGAVHVLFLSSDEIAIVHTYVHTAHGALYCTICIAMQVLKYYIQKYTLLIIMLCNHTVHTCIYMYCTLSHLHQVHMYVCTHVSVHTHTHAYTCKSYIIKFTNLL